MESGRFIFNCRFCPIKTFEIIKEVGAEIKELPRTFFNDHLKVACKHFLPRIYPKLITEASMILNSYGDTIVSFYTNILKYTIRQGNYLIYLPGVKIPSIIEIEAISPHYNIEIVRM